MGQWGSMTTTSFTAGALPAQTTVKFCSYLEVSKSTTAT